MHLELPDGNSAELISSSEITGRVNRDITYAQTRVVGLTAKWLSMGYDDPSGWADLDKNAPDYEEVKKSREQRIYKNLEITGNLSKEEQAVLDDYETALVLALTKSWSYEKELNEESLLDLPREVLDTLTVACRNEYEGTKVSVESDPDPKAPTENLAG